MVGLCVQVLKDSRLSVWMRNLELALFSVIIGLVGVYYVDEVLVSEHGFFYGYNPLVWTAVSLQVSRGPHGWAAGGAVFLHTCRARPWAMT